MRYLAAMSDPTHPDPSRAGTGADPHHAPGDHGDMHEHADAAHEAEALGPVDVAAWGAGALGLLIGVAMAVCFALATGAVAT